MLKLTLDHIYLSADPLKSIVGFSTKFRYSNGSFCYSRDGLSYPAAIRMFESLGFIQEAQALTARVTLLAPQADKLKAKGKEIISSNEPDNFVRYKQFEAEILGHLLNGFFITFSGEQYKKRPCDQYLCELTALENGHEYVSPTSEQFLRHAAKSLARFQDAYKRDEFLITPEDLRKLYLEHTGLVHENTLIPVPTGRRKIFEVIETLRKYIADEAGTDNVKLRMVDSKEVEGKAVTSGACMCRTCIVLLELKIGDQIRYLEYHSGSDPFRFLTQIGQTSL